LLIYKNLTKFNTIAVDRWCCCYWYNVVLNTITKRLGE